MLKHSLICLQTHHLPVGKASCGIRGSPVSTINRTKEELSKMGPLVSVFLPVPSMAVLAGCCEFCAQRPALAGAARSHVQAADVAWFAPCSLTVREPGGQRSGRERGVGEESTRKRVPSGEPSSCSRAVDRAITPRLWWLQHCCPWQAGDLNLSLAGKASGGKTPRVNLEDRLLKH